MTAVDSDLVYVSGHVIGLFCRQCRAEGLEAGVQQLSNWLIGGFELGDGFVRASRQARDGLEGRPVGDADFAEFLVMVRGRDLFGASSFELRRRFLQRFLFKGWLEVGV